MKKKITLILCMLTFVACIFALSVSASTLIDGLYYDLSGSGDNAKATLTSDNVNCTLENVVVPETVTHEGVTYKVTTLATNAFSGSNPKWAGNSYVKSIVIPESVTSFGSHIFRNCTGIETVVIKSKSASGITLSDAEFYSCANLKYVDMSDSDIVKLTKFTFAYCNKLETMLLPEKIESIGEKVFISCSSMKLTGIPDTVTYVGSFAFSGCSSVTGFKMSASIAKIDANAFQGTKMTSVILPETLKTTAKDIFNSTPLKFAVIPSDLSGFTSTLFSGTNIPVVIYTGSDASVAKSAIGALSGHTPAPFSEYDPSADYTGKKMIFYGAVTCGKCNGILGDEEFKFDGLSKEMKEQTECTNCHHANVSASYAPVIKSLGYSSFTGVNGKSVVQGFTISYDSLDKYNEVFADKQITGFGVLAVSKQNATNGTAFNEDGSEKTGVVNAPLDLTSLEAFDRVEIKVVNIPLDVETEDGTSYLDLEIYMSAYFNLGDEIVYVNDGLEGATLGQAITGNGVN